MENSSHTEVKEETEKQEGTIEEIGRRLSLVYNQMKETLSKNFSKINLLYTREEPLNQTNEHIDIEMKENIKNPPDSACITKVKHVESDEENRERVRIELEEETKKKSDEEPKDATKLLHDFVKYVDFLNLIYCSYRKHGYPIETHETTTIDGFVLQLQRIKHGRYDSMKVFPDEKMNDEELEQRKNKKRPVVMLQHGVLNSCCTWVISGPETALAFFLADAGYDVWLGNNRGTQFGRKHISKNEKEKEYWEWSFSEMGKYDLPAQIEYIIKHTNVETITYVGHSQGTTQAFVGFSINPELQKRVNLFIALAPVCTLKYQSNSAFKILISLKTEKLFQKFGM